MTQGILSGTVSHLFHPVAFTSTFVFAVLGSTLPLFAERHVVRIEKIEWEGNEESFTPRFDPDDPLQRLAQFVRYDAPRMGLSSDALIVQTRAILGQMHDVVDPTGNTLVGEGLVGLRNLEGEVAGRGIVRAQYDYATNQVQTELIFTDRNGTTRNLTQFPTVDEYGVVTTYGTLTVTPPSISNPYGVVVPTVFEGGMIGTPGEFEDDMEWELDPASDAGFEQQFLEMSGGANGCAGLRACDPYFVHLAIVVLIAIILLAVIWVVSWLFGWLSIWEADLKTRLVQKELESRLDRFHGVDSGRNGMSVVPV
ncbi:MAG: hypothetical protein AABZ47_02895 [Planctomycetota bacterium]